MRFWEGDNLGAAFPNTKVWAEEVLRRFMIRILRNGRARTLREAEPAEPSWSDFVGYLE